MLIAQISDVHLGFVPNDPGEMNARRLDAVLDRLAGLAVAPDLLVLSGDLVDRGDEESYQRLRDKLAGWRGPVLYALGNHDNRAAFGAVFPDQRMSDGFLQYEADCGELRLLVLDTLEEGRHGGGFCERRARWLAERLDAAPDRPTLLVLHHPPVESGIGWLTTDPAEPWVRRLAAAIQGRTNIVALLCGHFHRSISAEFEGFPVIVCPPTAPEAALALTPFDPAHPDGRPMILESPPACALHLWRGGVLISHIDRAEPAPVLVRYDATMQPLVERVIRERPGRN